MFYCHNTLPATTLGQLSQINHDTIIELELEERLPHSPTPVVHAAMHP